MQSAVVLFTRDLRLHDQPALTAAVEEAERVVPLFVLDDEILSRAAPNRVAFLLAALRDLDASLRTRGSALVIRRGDVVEETMRVATDSGSEAVFWSEDVSSYASLRHARLVRAAEEARLDARAHPGVTVIPPGDVATTLGSHFLVFTPYWNRWRLEPRRAVLPAPSRVRSPRVDTGRLPALPDVVKGEAASALPTGGEAAGRARLDAWLTDGLSTYEASRDDLAAEGTSRLSPYLHFGCLSPLEVAERAAPLPGGESFVRQLCWRDFHHQMLAAAPELSRRDLRDRNDRWRDDPEAFAAWQAGSTGYPLVDAGMRQLLAEGTMHNRARLVTASFLTKHLYVDWRLGAAHFAAHLVDGDVANNTLNWQWVAGTGADTRPNRVFNPIRQAQRYDPSSDYVRRWLPEVETADYPAAIVEHDEAVARFRAARSRDR